ncbi:MAG: GHKL domain-containing protein [Desulfamplus sp.]|nr:GHKL domain-containing protein [Desulfamplus sp.]
METLADQIKNKNARVNLPLQMPVVNGDLTLMTHILINIIENALKYSKEKEPPLIDVSFEIKEQYITISIADNGIGIEPEYHQKIFKIFQRLHGQEKYRGTGIGLAAVKKGVQLMAGEVWVESQPGSGSVFKIKLPVYSKSTPIDS